MFSIFNLIKEELQDYYSDWGTESSLGDKIFAKNQGQAIQEPQISNAELIGYVDKRGLEDISPPIPVYKNPKTLEGFSNDTRGILMDTGDLYVAQNYNALHANILDLLAEKNIIPYSSKFGYDYNYPANFIAVVRIGRSNTFGQSSAYDYFPNHYIQIFDNGEKAQPYGFQSY
jgi:hypothetical protein